MVGTEETLNCSWHQMSFNDLHLIVDNWSTGTLLNTPMFLLNPSTVFSLVCLSQSAEMKGEKCWESFCISSVWWLNELMQGRLLLERTTHKQPLFCTASKWTQLWKRVGATSVQREVVTHLKLFDNDRKVTSALEQLSLNKSLGSFQ